MVVVVEIVVAGIAKKSFAPRASKEAESPCG